MVYVSSFWKKLVQGASPLALAYLCNPIHAWFFNRIHIYMRISFLNSGSMPRFMCCSGLPTWNHTGGIPPCSHLASPCCGVVFYFWTNQQLTGQVDAIEGDATPRVMARDFAWFRVISGKCHLWMCALRTLIHRNVEPQNWHSRTKSHIWKTPAWFRVILRDFFLCMARICGSVLVGQLRQCWSHEWWFAGWWNGSCGMAKWIYNITYSCFWH